MLTIGSPMPEFALPNQNGETVRLSDLRGQPVVLFVFPKAFTGGCTTQACDFRDRLPQFQVGNAAVFGLSSDTVEELKRWHEAQHFTYDLMSDADHSYLETIELWGPHDWGGKIFVGSLRAHYVIDADGNLIDAQVGVDPAQSATLALQALAEHVKP